jgi:molybdate transport system substrate-binding protein
MRLASTTSSTTSRPPSPHDKRNIKQYIALFAPPNPRIMPRLFAAFLGLLLSTQALAADLTVSAAASLTNAFRALAPSFEARHPGLKLQFNFGASGALLQQIAKGAPVDVFASADQETMNQAQAQGLVKADQRRDFVSNALVVVVPAADDNAPRTLNDLRLEQYKRVAIGLPASVPVGRYTKGVLEKAGLWPSIEAKMIGAQSVRQALDYVARAEVDASFVYATDAAIMPDKVKVAFTVPTDVRILYPIAPIAAGANRAAAQSFVAFINSSEAQAVLAKYGFGAP